MFSKLLRDLTSLALLICLIGSNCYASEKASEDSKKSYLKNERTPLIKRESDENSVKKTLAKKKTKKNKFEYILKDVQQDKFWADLEKIEIGEIQDFTKIKSIKSFAIYIDPINDSSEHKNKLLKLMKYNQYISSLEIFGLYFDTECVKKMSEKGVVKSFSMTQNPNLQIKDKFYQALANNSCLSELKLEASLNAKNLLDLSKNKFIRRLEILISNISYDQAISFLRMPKLENLTVKIEDLTVEQEKKLMEKAHKKNIKLYLTKD